MRRTLVFLRLRDFPCGLCEILLLYKIPTNTTPKKSDPHLAYTSLQKEGAKESTTHRSSRIANIPASVTTFLKSAPLNASVNFTIAS